MDGRLRLVGWTLDEDEYRRAYVVYEEPLSSEEASRIALVALQAMEKSGYDVTYDLHPISRSSFERSVDYDIRRLRTEGVQ